MIVIRPGELVKAKIGDATFWLTPLTQEQLQEVIQHKSLKSGEEVLDTKATTAAVLKYGLKKIDGLTYSDGSQVKLEFDENGHLSQQTCDELAGASVLVQTLALQFTHGYTPQSTTGVEVSIESPSANKKKTRKA